MENGFELFADCATAVGEGPLWSRHESCLYWIDVFRGEVFRKEDDGDPKSFARFQLDIGKIGGMVMAEDGALVLFAARGRVWRWRPGHPPVLAAELQAAALTRFNDVIADPFGRVYCGVAPAEQGGSGSLWRLDADGGFACLEPVTAGMPNGMGFSPDLKYFYFTVTNERIIYRYDYEPDTGAISGRAAFIRVAGNEGFPDGMNVDAEGCLWSAQWNGGRLVRYSPGGEKLREYRSDISKITSVTSGGDNYTDIFVTTANHPWRKIDFERHRAGAVFRLKQKS